jgi:hypothetical protein
VAQVTPSPPSSETHDLPASRMSYSPDKRVQKTCSIDLAYSGNAQRRYGVAPGRNGGVAHVRPSPPRRTDSPAAPPTIRLLSTPRRTDRFSSASGTWAKYWACEAHTTNGFSHEPQMEFRPLSRREPGLAGGRASTASTTRQAQIEPCDRDARYPTDARHRENKGIPQLKIPTSLRRCKAAHRPAWRQWPTRITETAQTWVFDPMAP